MPKGEQQAGFSRVHAISDAPHSVSGSRLGMFSCNSSMKRSLKLAHYLVVMPTKKVNYKRAITGCIVTAFALVLAACSSKPGNTSSPGAQPPQPSGAPTITAAEKQRRSDRI